MDLDFKLALDYLPNDGLKDYEGVIDVAPLSLPACLRYADDWAERLHKGKRGSYKVIFRLYPRDADAQKTFEDNDPYFLIYKWKGLFGRKVRTIESWHGADAIEI